MLSMDPQNADHMEHGNDSVMIALYDFNAEQSPEVSLKQYEKMEMLDMDPALNGWAYGRKSDGSKGYVPISYLQAPQSFNHNNNHAQAAQHMNPNSNTVMNNMHPNNSRGVKNPRNMNQPSSDSMVGKPPLNNNSGYNTKTQKYVNSVGGANNNMQQQQHQQQPQPQQPRGGPTNYNKAVTNNLGNKNYGHGGYDELNEGNSVGSTHNNNQSQQQQAGAPQPSNVVNDARQLICSFHRDFIPEMDDLYKYFGSFGKVINKIEIEYDAKRVPMARIRFQSPQSVLKVCDKGNRQQIPSANQTGNIYIRVYRTMEDYITSMQQQQQRSNRGGSYGNKKQSRRQYQQG